MQNGMSKMNANNWEITEVFSEDPSEFLYYEVIDEFGNTVAACFSKSQAEIVAAAPEMLEALEETVYMRGIPDDDEARNGYEKRLMAAIAKARGETA